MAPLEVAPHVDCAIIGGGPAGLTAGLYLARYHRQFVVIESGESRAARIPKTHNLPFFPDGISGRALIDIQTRHLGRYGVVPQPGRVEEVTIEGGLFHLRIRLGDARELLSLAARKVLLATGASDVDIDMPGLAEAVADGAVRYCPICDGYEAGSEVAVIGSGEQAGREALFIARTYGAAMTLLVPPHLEGDEPEPGLQRDLREAGVELPAAPLAGLTLGTGDGSVEAVFSNGSRRRFGCVYVALGLTHRSSLAIAMGAAHDEDDALVVDEHNMTSIDGLYAAGGTVRGLDQIVVAMGHAAVAATAIHNRCPPVFRGPGFRSPAFRSPA